MILNKLIDNETFYSLIEMFQREGKKVVNKVSNDKYKSFVIESEQYIFTDDLNNVNKNIFLESFIGKDVDAKEYIEHHGKKPSGAGKWIFGIGSRNKRDWFSFDGNFSQAKNAAYEEAEKRGKKKIYVMEDFNFKYVDVSYKIIKESNVEYKVSLIVEDKEIYATKALTENSARNIGTGWLFDKLIEVDLLERKMNKAEKKKSESIVKGMKKKIGSFKDRYGKDAKQVMYATANKLAKESKVVDHIFPEVKKPLKIWKFNRITGYWKFEKTIEKREDAQKWLEVFQKDEPKEFFKLSANKPNNNPMMKKESIKKESLENKLKLIIEEESFEELSSEPTYRKPYKAVEAEPQFVDGWKIVDNLGQSLSGVYTKEEAKTLVDILNSSSEVSTMGYKSLHIKDGEGEKVKDRSLKGVKLKEIKESKNNNLINDIIENEYGTAHGGIQHFSNVNGKEYSWNFVNILNNRYNAVLNKKDAVGIYYTIGNDADVGFGKRKPKQGFLPFNSELKESTKNFKIKFEQKSTDGTQTTNGEKVISAPDAVLARKRVEEDNKDLPGFRVISVSEVV